jgi:tripartite-type tricarboxylate transporter receptor subunit TctC
VIRARLETPSGLQQIVTEDERREIMKSFVLCVILAVSVFGPIESTLQAQTYPGRPIQLIIPNVPGSIMDINSRTLAEELGKILGTQIVSINKPGAGTLVGTEAVAKGKKDGYTLGYLSGGALVYSRILNPETVHFDVDKDLEPLGLHLIIPMALAVQADSPWKTFNDLVDYAKKNPGKLRVDTMGIGTASHFNLEIIQSLTGAQFTHVPFKGGESVITALLGGHVEMTFDAMNKMAPHVESGKLRVLLLTNKMAEFPKIPTMTELGYKKDLIPSWFAMYAPGGLPEDVIKLLVPAVEKTIRNPELKARTEKMYFVVDYRSPAQLKKMVTEEYEQALVIANGIGLRKKN